VKINQDARLYVTLLKPGDEVAKELDKGRYGWLQVAKGAIVLNGQKLAAGDGAAISDEQRLTIQATVESEVLFFDLA
jgi:quercetin 2,3-dioxygenase